jgi:hypothetical protein
LTIGDDGAPVVETESVDATEAADIPTIMEALIDNPGGRSGTTVAITVTLATGIVAEL